MKYLKRVAFIFLLALFYQPSFSQAGKAIYHPCFLMDSVENHLDFIRLNASRIFIDSFDCKQMLFDSITAQYIRTKQKKYIDALTYIHSSSAAHLVENLYTDVLRKLVQNDFTGFLDLLYSGRGKYQALEKELIATMNMIIDGRPYKLKYMGLMNVEISKAKDNKEAARAAYLEKLKVKIEEEKY